MATFNVTIVEEVTYEMTVQAESPDAAVRLAESTFLDSDDPNQWFTSVDERDIYAEKDG